MDTEIVFESQTKGEKQGKKLKIIFRKDSPFQTIEDMPWTPEMKNHIVRNSLPGYPENAFVYAIGQDLMATSVNTGFKIGTVDGKACVIGVDVNNNIFKNF